MLQPESLSSTREQGTVWTRCFYFASYLFVNPQRLRRCSACSSVNFHCKLIPFMDPSYNRDGRNGENECITHNIYSDNTNACYMKQQANLYTQFLQTQNEAQTSPGKRFRKQSMRTNATTMFDFFYTNRRESCLLY